MRYIEEYRRDYGDEHNNFIQTGDGDDWLPAFKRAMHEHINPNPADEWRRFRTYRTTILLRPRVYRLSDTLHLYRGLTIKGEGFHSQLYFDQGTDGIVMHFLEYSGTPGTHPSGYGGSSRLEDLLINGTNAPGTVGVHIHSASEAYNVRVQDFGWHGWFIDADAQRPNRSNVNGWTLVECSTVNCGRNPGADTNGNPRLPGCGLRIDGGDTNVGYSRKFNARNCGGWGIDDSSFLGNTHVQPHTAGCGNTSGAPDPYDGPLAYRSEGAGQRTVWVNPYVEIQPEQGIPLCDIKAPAIRINGLGGLMTHGSHWMRAGSFRGSWEFVGTDETFLFGVNFQYQADLDNTDITNVQSEFVNRGITLPPNPQNIVVTIEKRSQRWQIYDQINQQRYSIRRGPNDLEVFRVNTYELEMGNERAFLQFGSTADHPNRPYRLKYIPLANTGQQDQHVGFYRLDYANLDRAVALLLTGSQSYAPNGRQLDSGRIILLDHYFGRPMLRQGYGTQRQLPSTNLDEWPIGSRFCNTEPEPGGYEGWVLVRDPNTGLPVWKGYGLIEQ